MIQKIACFLCGCAMVFEMKTMLFVVCGLRIRPAHLALRWHEGYLGSNAQMYGYWFILVGLRGKLA